MLKIMNIFNKLGKYQNSEILNTLKKFDTLINNEKVLWRVNLKNLKFLI